jgi:fibronectin type 3 domain-containing protein
VGLWATTSGRGATLNWLPTTEADIAGYNVYRSLTSGTDYERLNRSLITKLFYRDTGLKKGETYYYVITAVNTSGGESGDSNEVEVIVAKGKSGKGK